MRLTKQRESDARELPVRKWLGDAARAERDDNWAREMLRKREQLQRERLADRSA